MKIQFILLRKFFKDEGSAICHNGYRGNILQMELIADIVRKNLDRIHFTLIIMSGIFYQNQTNRRRSMKFK